jgi:DNA modification methylase
MGQIPLIVTDPPYGKILKNAWDKTRMTQEEFSQWMIDWTNGYKETLQEGGSFYVWGGVGKKGFRPFFLYSAGVEAATGLEIKNLITWGKKRAYGVKDNYLFTREELLYMVKGKVKRFNIPLLDKERGYAGYNAKYPAKSKYLRRTNVWTDITELFRGKIHEAEKPVGVYRIPIEAHTEKGEYVLDMFGGSGVCAEAAVSVGRKYIVIERDVKNIKKILDRLGKLGE